MGQLSKSADPPSGVCLACGGLKEWSTTDELCAWLGIDREQLYWLNSTGQGPRRHRIGKTMRYRRADVEEWLLTRAAADLSQL